MARALYRSHARWHPLETEVETEKVAPVVTHSARPRFIGPDGRWLFAWHHPARPDMRRGAAVVLCPPLGYDYICVYRTWRILAERLSALGFDAIRFDYDGTGDSAGDPEEPGRPEAWLRSIEDAITEARELAGSSMVALVGLRLGATLALQAAAARGGVDRLVLWSPFHSGRAYLHELKAFARLSRQDHVPENPEEPDIRAAGHVVTGQTAEALARWDLDALASSPAPRILIVDRDDLAVDSSIGDRLQTLGCQVTRIRPPGTVDMLAQSALAKVPEDALDAITDWLGDWRPQGTRPAACVEKAHAESPKVARGPGHHERALRFGPGDRLFGILTAPAGAASSAPAIVLLNTGCEYHVGPNRLYVPLAREWAARGHVVLRYDLGGIGDSAPPPGADENVVYPAHALDDVREAIALVRREAPGRQIIVAGLCSGGWLAFLAAREGLPVDAIVSVNPPLYLRDGSSGSRRLAEYDELGRYQRSMRDPGKWAKALRGRAAYGTFVRLAVAHLGREIAERVGVTFAGRPLEGLARDLEGIAGRGITSLFVFSRGDGGLDYFRLYARLALHRRIVRKRIRYSVVDGAGHTFRPAAAQRALRELLVEFVARVTRTSSELKTPNSKL
jgi:alpha-beta hydrolase superfamily lysophospholipase